MSATTKGPTVKSIAEDLTVAMEVDGTYGYDYDEVTDTIHIETYTNDGQLDRTFTAIITIKETY